MAIDKLGLYNDALLILGKRKLDSLTEAREPRYRLDDAYDAGAIDTCLELVKPNSCSKTTVLSSPSAGSTFDYSHALPSDYINIIQPFSDSNLDQPITRYIIEGTSILCDFDTVYLRFISNGYAITDWDISFFRVVAAYLAKESATRLTGDEFERVEGIFEKRVQIAKQLEQEKVNTQNRASTPTNTLSAAWLKIFNDALFILGLDELAGNDDDSNRRVKLARALDSNLVESVLEDTGWQFGHVSEKINYDTSIEPSWGYNRAFNKPSKLHRLDGIYTDEHMQNPLKAYVDEGSNWFCSFDEIYVTYISTDFLVNPSNWPAHFQRLIAARMAKDTAMSLRSEGASNPDYCEEIYKQRKDDSMSTDAMASPPRRIANGNWSRARAQGNYRRNRP